MKYPEIEYVEENALELDSFREMDYFAVNNYNLTIELMMENAGLQLANFIAGFADINQTIKIGVGNGNNGGGGLVAARRLSAWGFNVYLDIFTKITKSLPAAQLKRALKFGVKTEADIIADVWVDAYLGFSQRLPLNQKLIAIIDKANSSTATKVSLDIPTGFLGDTNSPYFQSDKVITLAAPKKVLYKLPATTEIFVADLGIPKEVYEKFGMEIPPFQNNNIIKIIPTKY